MDFTGDEMGLLYQGGRCGAKTDPIEFFVKMLSLSPNSRTMFAEKLLLFAGETPGGMRTALSPALPSPAATTASSSGSGSSSGCWSGGGTIVSEVTDEGEVDEVLRNVPFAAEVHATAVAAASTTPSFTSPSTTTTTITTDDLGSAVFSPGAADMNASMSIRGSLAPSYHHGMPGGDPGLVGGFPVSSDAITASTAEWSNYAYTSNNDTLTMGHSVGGAILIPDTGAKPTTSSFGAYTGVGGGGNGEGNNDHHVDMVTQQQQQQHGYTDGKGGQGHRNTASRFSTGGILGV
ncbi:hypothetical protein F4810DRAFT_395672 [Camillea tinctor]|nr:hypothetical protein F4810DRAFT_395672 [Camillea tinctor]